MSALTSSSSISNLKSINGITDINVTSRIDYSLRFTKQVVLVVGESTDDYSQVARQYLITLSNQESVQTNTAFIPASAKLNNIQIRCRLIEQLFTNTLFDPEQSLAQSVLRLAQQQNDVISIVIEHAQLLSLQIKYELCQLVLAAKKADISINVVLFGSFKTGQEITGNKTLFKNKLAVIDAKSGKIYSYEDPKLAQSITPVKIHLWNKISLAIGVLLILLISVSYFIYINIADNKTYSGINDVELNKMTNEISTGVGELFATKSSDQPKAKVKFVATQNITENTNALLPTKLNRELNENNLATYNDINNVLLNIAEVSENQVTATSIEVFNALLPEETVSVKKQPKIKQTTSKINSSNVPVNRENQVNELILNDSSAYYRKSLLSNNQGYVVQIAGFSDQNLLHDFITAYPSIELHHYYKSLQGKLFSVVTSISYATKGDARAAIALLPKTLRERQPWIKSISIVIDEINTFEQ